MSNFGHNGSPSGARPLSTDSHEEFQALCALATSGELPEPEQARLREHLAGCSACRQLLKEYEEIAANVLPEIASELHQKAGYAESEDRSWSLEKAEARLMDSLRSASIPANRKQPALLYKPAAKLAIAATLVAALAFGSYQLGRKSELRGAGRNNSPSLPGPTATSPLPSTAAKREAETKDKRVADLERELAQGRGERTQLDDQLSRLNEELTKRDSELKQATEERVELGHQLDETNMSAKDLEAKMSNLGNQSAQDSQNLLILRTRIHDLNAALEEKDKQIAQDQELLAHDRDIRNLVSARNLYIAEIYDVGKSGDTEKPFGRIFYTKDKSLIFYGYDLDQQRGTKKNASFQVWGRQRTDSNHDVSLGLLYLDDAEKKRWVLKFNDSETIAHLDAVFITVEPQGGSSQPTGKPLLFTYLRLDPNHP